MVLFKLGKVPSEHSGYTYYARNIYIGIHAYSFDITTHTDGYATLDLSELMWAVPEVYDLGFLKL